MAYMPVSMPPGPQTGPRDAIHDASPPPPAGSYNTTHYFHTLYAAIFIPKKKRVAAITIYNPGKV